MTAVLTQTQPADISLVGVSRNYELGDEKIHALRNLSLDIRQGDIMKVSRVLVVGIVAAVLAGCALSSTGMVDLDPVPYSFHPPSGLESKLSVESMAGDWAEQAYAAGVTSAVTVTYTPDVGEPTTLMGVYYMPESVFDAAANPNEPPVYGTEVARADGHVLAVAGPQDSIYDPATDDGKNLGLLYDALYDPESYMAK